MGNAVNRRRIQSMAAYFFVLSASANALETHQYYAGEITSNLALEADGNIWYGTIDSVGRFTSEGTPVLFPLAPSLNLTLVALGPDGNIWTLSSLNYPNMLYVVTPSGSFASTFVLPSSQYIAMTAGADGKMWIGSDFTSTLTSVDTSGQTTSYPVPSAINAISSGPDNTLWASAGTQILRIELSGSVTAFNMSPDELSLLEATAIVAGPDGNMWLPTNTAGCPYSPCMASGAAVVSVSVDGERTLYQLPNSEQTAALGLAFGADGNPWVTAIRFDINEVLLLRLTPNGMFTAYVLDTYPKSLVSDSVGNLWLSDGGFVTEIVIPADLVFSDAFDVLPAQTAPVPYLH